MTNTASMTDTAAMTGTGMLTGTEMMTGTGAMSGTTGSMNVVDDGGRKSSAVSRRFSTQARYYSAQSVILRA